MHFKSCKDEELVLQHEFKTDIRILAVHHTEMMQIQELGTAAIGVKYGLLPSATE